MLTGVARRGDGFGATLRAFASQVHPVFMLPPLAAAWFGAFLAEDVSLVVGTVHMTAMFFAVYTAHVKDGYVDFYRRGEDDTHPMTEFGCRVGLIGAALGFSACLLGLWWLSGPGAALLALPTWFIGYLHAPQLDTNPVTATAGYPVGIGFCIVGGYYAQAGEIATVPLAFAGVFLVVLTGIKVIDDAQDYDYDRSIAKRTVAVVLGPDDARRLAYWLMGGGLFAVVVLVVNDVFPPGSLLGVAAFGGVAVLARPAGPTRATMLLVRGAYLLLAGSVIAVFYRPFSGLPLPDIGVFGPFTYLATELAFGTVAVVLLYRAGAITRAARTVAVLYPIAYVWDWYTLTVGVFAIELRTGVDLLGIPIEEHLFMLVVPALVLGIHETLRAAERERRNHDGRDAGPNG